MLELKIFLTVLVTMAQNARLLTLYSETWITRTAGVHQKGLCCEKFE